MKLIISGKPFGKQRPKFSTRGGRGRTYTPSETVNYENLIKITYSSLLNQDKLIMSDKPLTADIKAYYPIPISFSKDKSNKALSGDLQPTIKPDTDNIAKICLDALNGLAYVDDKQIVRLTVSKYYSRVARVEIEINEV